MNLEQEEKMWGDKCRKHLMDSEKLSAEDADKKLAAMSDEEKAALKAKLGPLEDWAKEEEAEHGMSAEQEAKMKAAREQFTKLSAGMRAGFDGVKLAAKKSSIVSRLSRLKAEAKITPAEIKKFQAERLEKLAKESDATINAVIKSYEDREPVILTGVIGSKKGANPGDAYRGSQLSALEAETRANMPFLAQVSSNTKKLSEGQKPHEEMAGQVAHEEMGGQVAVEQMTEGQMTYETMSKLMDEGKLADVKEHLKKMMEELAGHRAKAAGVDVGHSDEKELGKLAESIEKMQTEYKQLTELTAALLGIEKV